MIGGWRDGYPNPPVRTFANLDVPKRLLMGPWNHTRPDRAIPGPCIDYLAEVVRWCDHWLKGESNAVMDEPPIQVFMQAYDEPRADRIHTSGYWRAERELPPPPSDDEGTYFLGEGSLLTDAPLAAGDFDEYEYLSLIHI